MVIRSLVIATLLAGAASAHATPTSSAASTLSGWTLQSGSVSVVGNLDAMIASGNWAAFSQAWNMHTSVAAGTTSGTSAVLFSPNAKGGMSGVGFTGGPAAAVGGSASGGGADVGGGGSAGVGGGSGGGGIGGSGGIGGGIGGGTELDVPGNGGGLGNDVPVGPGNNNGQNDDVVAPNEIPEPGSIALLLAGLAGAGFVARRRTK